MTGVQTCALPIFSEHNNTESHARRAAERVLEKYGSRARLFVGSQSHALEPVLLEPERALPLRKARQLALFAV